MSGTIDRRGARVGGSTRPLGTIPSQERWRVTGKPRRDGGLTHWFGVENASGTIVRGVVVASSEDPLEAQRGERAAQALWTIDHRSVPKPMAVGLNSSGELVVVYVAERAPSLVSLLTEGAMNPARVVALGIQLFDALAVAHEAGLVHGALSADQLRVVADGPHDLLVVEGIGVRALCPVTVERVVADDLYAAGQILYQMLLGQLAADFGHAGDDDVDPLRELPYAGPLIDLVRACLDPRPSARPASARAARAALMSIADPWESARPHRARVPEIVEEVTAPIGRKLARVGPTTAPFEPPPAPSSPESEAVSALALSNERLWATVVAAILAIIAVLLVALPDRAANASANVSDAALQPLPPTTQVDGP